MALHAVVLAGGTGSRLWPRSTPDSPKQFQAVLADRTLLQLAVERAALTADDVWVVTDERYVPTVRSLVPDVPAGRVLGEPAPRGTLGAVLLAAAAIGATDPEAVLALLPSDHLCEDEPQLGAAIRRVAGHLGGRAIGLVASPSATVHPAFGHVRPGEVVDLDGAVTVARVGGYVEKPGPDAVLDGGPWLRNLGIVIGRASALLGAAPPGFAEAAARVAGAEPGGVEAWAALPAERIEDAVLPVASDLLVACAPLEWVDVGTWPALFEHAERTGEGNLVDGPVTAVDAAGNVVMTTGAPVAVIGVRDLLVVVTPEQVVVCHRDRSDRIVASLGD